MNDSDLQLLHRYARNNSQDSFATLVKRHLNLVFSAALRQVRSPQLAEEVAQSVFADLAQSATKLKPDTILPAWLYEVTRRTAIDVVRRESRRQLREKVAHELTAMNATADDWKDIEPFLDEAMHALDEIDRTAVLLRYFENKSLREVGETLGTSDDAAQKRVSRAVERLREFFTKRGVTIGPSGLVVVISANAVQAAPIGLAVTISSAAAFAGTSIVATTATFTKTIAMTTIQKTLIAATLVAAVGTGIYEATQAAQLREQNQVLMRQQAGLTAQIHQLQTERELTRNEPTSAAKTVSNMQGHSSELLKLRGEVGVLRNQAIESSQKERAVEQKLTELLSSKAKFTAHETAMVNTAKHVGLAMMMYADDNGGRFPTDFNQLTNLLRGKLGEMGVFSFDRINIGAEKLDPENSTRSEHPDLVVVRERLSRPTPDGTWSRIYGFADGRVVTATSYEGNFDAWEKVNTYSPPPTPNQ